MRKVLPVLLLIPSLGLAHTGAGAVSSFAAGAAHPLSGADHVLAMLAVGLWAAHLSGRALWLLPAGFVGAMALGFGAATQGLPLPAVEPLILASAPVLGLLVALAARPPLALAVAVTAGFGVFHGHAHGAAMGAAMGAATALDYLAGFASVTMALHLAGMATGLAIARVASPGALRGGGAVVAALGAWLVTAG